jgi:hypothetical protein
MDGLERGLFFMSFEDPMECLTQFGVSENDPCPARDLSPPTLVDG